MKLIEPVELHDYKGRPSRRQEWKSEDNFVFIIREENDEETVSICVKNAQDRTCTTSIYKKFISRYGDRYEVSYRRSGGSASIICRREDLNLVMGLLESMDKSRLYFDETV